MNNTNGNKRAHNKCINIPKLNYTVKLTKQASSPLH